MRSLWLQHKRLQLDDLLTNRKHIIQSKSHKKVEEEASEQREKKKKILKTFAIA